MREKGYSLHHRFFISFYREAVRNNRFVPRRGEWMIIQSSAMQMASARTYSSKSLHFTSVRALNGNEEEQQNSFSNMVNDFQNTKSVNSLNLGERLQAIHQIQSQTLNYLLQMLFGRGTNGSAQSIQNSLQQDITQDGYQAQVGYQLQTTRYTSYFHMEENETTSFQTNGTVITADGRHLDFAVDVTLSRSFVEETESFVDYKQPVLCDPLVIQLNNSLPGVSDQKFLFDLDADGEEEEISLLGKGNAFLALDKNEDGIINDGTELFGVQSGNGFADLAAYDVDKNGWIDEADEVFDKLKVWCRDEEGNDKLLTLKEAGIGAICLDNQNTPFAYRNSRNETNAMARRTGIFLYENGNSGTIQQIDMATQEKTAPQMEALA